jgi:hypothetical protein
VAYPLDDAYQIGSLSQYKTHRRPSNHGEDIDGRMGKHLIARRPMTPSSSAPRVPTLSASGKRHQTILDNSAESASKQPKLSGDIDNPTNGPGTFVSAPSHDPTNLGSTATQPHRGMYASPALKVEQRKVLSKDTLTPPWEEAIENHRKKSTK